MNQMDLLGLLSPLDPPNLLGQKDLKSLENLLGQMDLLHPSYLESLLVQMDLYNLLRLLNLELLPCL